ncbi:MAG: histidinol-phosphate transaminase [Oscillospiraceae bacterium]|nr:histidinol-phosphate transaminase [Oscillospiraceae bacterium]
MSRFFAGKLASLKEYTPGEQPKDQVYIKLNTNESPYPPSNGVIEAVNSKEVELLRLYPDPDCTKLKEKIASLYGVEKENVFVSNGSDDILNFAFLAFGEGGAAFADITYGFYKVFAALHGVKSQIMPLESDFSIDPKKYYGLNKFIAIANPNAPTGLFIDPSEIEKVAVNNPDSVVLVDEAYVDFGGKSCIPLTKKLDNLLVVATYSKSRSLAGARLGYAIGNKELISDLEKIKFSTNPYSINRLTLLAGEAAIDDDNYYKANCQRIIEAREYAKSELEKLGFYVTDSKANFLFARSPDISGKELYLKLREKGILVRHFDDEKITDFNRITVGTMEEMQTLVKAVKEILG